ncbi:MAG: hypothetical protein K2X28_09125 [Alphaproteobacteria bacterium]|nr:hypothetical protein [Alphaproteobacteria bacterium]
MRKKLTYVLLATLLVTGSSAFAMMEEGVSGQNFSIQRSKVIDALKTGKELEIGGHKYKVTGTIDGTAGEMFKTAPDPMVHFYNGWTYDKAPTEWQYLFDISPHMDEHGHEISPGADGVADLHIKQVE